MKIQGEKLFLQHFIIFRNIAFAVIFKYFFYPESKLKNFKISSEKRYFKQTPKLQRKAF